MKPIEIEQFMTIVAQALSEMTIEELVKLYGEIARFIALRRLQEEPASPRPDVQELRKRLSNVMAEIRESGASSERVDWLWRVAQDAITFYSVASKPIDMLLFCPNPACGVKHVDAPDPSQGWDNPPHRSHKCHVCHTIWRPADVPTNGVIAIKTKGKDDNYAIP